MVEKVSRRRRPVGLVAHGIVLGALAPAAMAGQTWFVDDDAPSDPGAADCLVSDSEEDATAGHPYDCIGEAIDIAGPGDEILVSPGTYYEKIDLGGKAIVLRSTHGPGVTTIDATGIGGRVVTCSSFEGASTVLQGFTITGGNAGSGAGMSTLR